MNSELLQCQSQYSNEEVITPFVQVFEHSVYNFKQTLTITESLDVMFPEQRRQDKELVKAKELLGNLATNFTDQEIKEMVTDIDFLVEGWLDDFERELFKNKTLKELLHDKGGL